MTTFIHYGKVAHFTEENVLVLDGKIVGEFKGLKEAKEYCESLRISEELKESIVVEEPIITESQIALVLKEDGEIKPSQSVVAFFNDLIETKKFIPCNALITLREKRRNIEIPGKIDYVLEDGSKIALDFETNFRLNSLIDSKDSADLIRFMTSNHKNFMYVVEQVLEED